MPLSLVLIAIKRRSRENERAERGRKNVRRRVEGGGARYCGGEGGGREGVHRREG